MSAKSERDILREAAYGQKVQDLAQPELDRYGKYPRSTTYLHIRIPR